MVWCRMVREMFFVSDMLLQNSLSDRLEYTPVDSMSEFFVAFLTSIFGNLS